MKMGFLYGATSKVLRLDHYKIGMTLCKNEADLKIYLSKRYGTPYGCCVEIAIFKEVGNPRIAEKHIHNILKEYCVGGELYNCTLDIIQKAMDSVPETDVVVKESKSVLSVLEAVSKYTKVPQEFTHDFASLYDKNTLPTDFVVNLDLVAKWLNGSKHELSKTLKATYTENVDYTKVKTKNPASPKSKYCINYMLTLNCFKLVCMATAALNGPTVRQYFIEIEQMYTKYHKQLMTVHSSKIIT